MRHPLSVIYLGSMLISVFASTTHADSSSSQPTLVRVGIYVDQITGLSLKENQFNVDFYLWFR